MDIPYRTRRLDPDSPDFMMRILGNTEDAVTALLIKLEDQEIAEKERTLIVQARLEVANGTATMDTITKLLELTEKHNGPFGCPLHP